MKYRTPETRRECVEKRYIVSLVKGIAKRHWEKFGQDLSEDFTGTRKLLFCMTKNYRTKSNKHTKNIIDENGNTTQIVRRLKEYFESLLNVEQEGNLELKQLEGNISENQYGFIPGRGTTDQLSALEFILKSVGNME